MKNGNSGFGRVLLTVVALASQGALANGSVKGMLDGFVDTGTISGVVSILSDADYNVQTDCSGWADVERRIPVTERSVFAVFSMTKSFTGIAMMCATDEGKISLDDKVEKFLPEFADVKMKDGSRPKRPLVVRDLVCHSTGSRYRYDCINSPLPIREVARRLASEPLMFQPGETFEYGNAWICAAAACLEVVTGEPYEKYLQRKVLDPLGMKDTTFWPNEEQQRRLVKAYTSDEYRLRPGKDVCTPQLDFPKTNRVYAAASGGLFSTPADMIRFSQMLAHHGTWKGKTIVSQKTFDGIFAIKQTAANVLEPYTVGAWIWGDWIGHEGAMRTDQRANLKTGHSRLFFINTENAAGPAFFQLKAVWQFVCDRIQGTKTTVFGT